MFFRVYGLLDPAMAEGNDTDDDEVTEFTEEELIEEFRTAVDEVIDESDYATMEEVEEIVGEISKEHESRVEVDEEEQEEDEIEQLPDRLEELGVPDDLIREIEEALDVGNISKELGVRHVDGYLAQQLEDGGGVLADRREKAEEVQDAVAEAVAEEANDEKLVDHTVYEGEEGV